MQPDQEEKSIKLDGKPLTTNKRINKISPFRIQTKNSESGDQNLQEYNSFIESQMCFEHLEILQINNGSQ